MREKREQMIKMGEQFAFAEYNGELAYSLQTPTNTTFGRTHLVDDFPKCGTRKISR